MIAPRDLPSASWRIDSGTQRKTVRFWSTYWQFRLSTRHANNVCESWWLDQGSAADDSLCDVEVVRRLEDEIILAMPLPETLERESPPRTLEFEQKLDRLAEVAISSGLGLAPGQELVLTATLDAIPLVRRVTEHAYRAGASVVTTLFTDEEATLLRYQHGQEGSFDVAPSWLYQGMAEAFRSGAARLAIMGDNPALLARQDPDKVSRA